ncbi:MAG: lytic murein transglycosylase [Minisyncoccia bacterium]
MKILKDIKKFRYKIKKPIKTKSFNFRIKDIFIVIVVFLSFVFESKAAAPILNIPTYTINENLLAQNLNIQELRQSLQKELDQILKEIDAYKKQIEKLSAQRRTLQGEINYLNAQISKTELEIKAIKLSINNLNKRIGDTKNAIVATEKNIEKSKSFLTQSLRAYYQASRKSIVEVILADQNLSDYFSNVVYLNKLQESINEQIEKLKDLNRQLTYQKAKLEEALSEQNNLLELSELKKKELNDLQAEKNNLLNITKGVESKYQSLVQEKEKRAAEIRAQLFKLAGGVGPINFGQAVEYAELVSKFTGVRPAFLLAILHYESKIGQNVGSCNYKDSMKPSEQPIFEQITKELGLDPNKMPVSCRQWYGWGGAMGPAQFLPSTWMKYKDKIAQITGNNPPNPWNILDSFAAAALYLSNVGANAKTYDAEWRAAMIYFAGSNWSKPELSFYGDSVMRIASKFEEDIKIMKGS